MRARIKDDDASLKSEQDKNLIMQSLLLCVHRTDDDVPHRPHPQDDCLSSPQARRYWRLSDAERTSLEASLVQTDSVASC